MKAILVDATHTFVSPKGLINKKMFHLLEKYPNDKIILTNADDEQMAKFGLNNMPYKVFTLKHNPDKVNPQYFKKMLNFFDLNSEDVVCFEHSPEAVESAKSVGIITHYYDEKRKDLRSLRQFLDNNL